MSLLRWHIFLAFGTVNANGAFCKILIKKYKETQNLYSIEDFSYKTIETSLWQGKVCFRVGSAIPKWVPTFDQIGTKVEQIRSIPPELTGRKCNFLRESANQ